MVEGDVSLHLLQTRLRHRILQRGVNRVSVQSLLQLTSRQPTGCPVVESTHHPLHIRSQDALTVSLLLPPNSLVKDPIDGAVRCRRMLGGGGGSDDDDGNDKTDDSDLDEPGWRITREMLDHVDSSDWLRSELGDRGLRRMIFEIDKADLKASRSSGGDGCDGGR